MKKAKTISMTLIVFFGLFAFSTLAMSEALTFDITPKAELKKVSMYLKEVVAKSKEHLIVFDVTIKNTDSVPNLYSVTVVIPDIGGGEDFIPVEEEKKLAPKAEGTTSVGILYPKFPTSGFTIKVEAIESR
jgi:hypothetical protein